MDRKDVMGRIENQPWFQASDVTIQHRLRSMSDDCTGFLAHLAQRPMEGGGVRLVALKDLLIPDGRIFGMLVNFTVAKIDDPSIAYAYQYFIWKQGEASGVKGVLLLANANGDITHIMCQRGFSFAVGADEYDAFGGFAEPDDAGVRGILTRFEKELKEEAGIDSLDVTSIFNLGRILVDRGMTPNRPYVFAAVVNAAAGSKVREGECVNPDPYEMRMGPLLVPVRDLWGPEGFLMKNDDSFLHVCVSRLVALGVLRPS
ncbi:hypothetical protein A3E39_00120 [Candidatus Uhrbacteria bacterium RIFCSPHIGHO2_12_FULL_60_25]|uniref:Nudix hydrolase domain-containing protein n=1 Tax=Candidatus Uhrbacteria bacterium RIFCSPHIGHO2_12_FULL_60_25 TaxID=1802399 RepID=A0A1F7UMM0_9BACT|nr:MAG: hypothetical protein A3D73_01410 [Candidatus Uhrbacteria bacterium RIFCSPHIGHO2_02_FULL_60_44]OGL79512.1 MAG: hypothetical protein A3E39_00120 [Candidatus Uhrbacteria bacterium RIFCSPHIGHO2_12_FULL_60_25]